MTAREDAQQQANDALGAKQRLQFQRSQLNKRSPLYGTRVSGIDMQLTEVEKDLTAANEALAEAIRAERQE